jgi:hypothetical protein
MMSAGWRRFSYARSTSVSTCRWPSWSSAWASSVARIDPAEVPVMTVGAMPTTS